MITPEEFDAIKNLISFEFSADNLFAENKEQEVLNGRLETLRGVESYKGIYYSKEHIMRNILRFSEEDITEMEKQIKKEKYDEDDERKAINMNNGIAPEEGEVMPEEAPKVDNKVSLEKSKKDK